MPSFVASSVDKTRSPLDHPRYPFETPLPESSVFYLLRWHPELNGTRLADHVAAEASAHQRERARDGLTDARAPDKVTRLAAGTEVVVTYAKQLPDKKTRYLIVKPSPVVGWVAGGAVAEARPARDDDDR
ncbi:hypothetical protein SO694_00050010 [Aureococcus anophagefferens]|uniref:SH3 domain-containing protein n=1 Tax=Aureococcus anophagefferens TaxID=44056 RepID=A0ABR1FYH4_AURAN